MYKQKVLWHRFAVKQALLTALSSFPYGQFMPISRQLQIIEVKGLCNLSDKAETRNMYMFDFGKFIIYGAAGLLLQGTSRLSSISKQQRLIWDSQKWSQSDFHKRSHKAAWRKLVMSGKMEQTLLFSMCGARVYFTCLCCPTISFSICNKNSCKEREACQPDSQTSFFMVKMAVAVKICLLKSLNMCNYRVVCDE